MTSERITPRLPALPAEGLDPERRALDAKLREGVDRYLQGFVSARSDGALIGPFPPMLHFPEFGGPAWDLFLALAEHTTLSKPVHEVVILRVGASTTAMYELYSHEVRARAAGLAESKIRTIAAGERPADLADDEAIAFDLTAVLMSGRQVPNSVYDAAVQTFGARGTAEIAYLVGCYQLISTLLNLYDVAAPAPAEA